MEQLCQLREDTWDRTTQTEQSRQVRPTGSLEQPGPVSLERTEMTGLPRHDSDVKRAVANETRAGHKLFNFENFFIFGTGQQLGQDSRDRTHRSGQDVLDRTSGTGDLGQECRDRLDWTSRPIGNLDRTART
jgi:hypothetical protein